MKIICHILPMKKIKNPQKRPSSKPVDQQPNSSETGVAQASPVLIGATLEHPPAEYLVELARGETNRKLVEGYKEVIRVLRNEKGFSFREIGQWLTNNGIPANYNDVYRVYTKGMPDYAVAELDAKEAQED